ncbi:hypothetical protein [Shewanella gaetbuli]|uniref:Uncharacterized protein n=1 Tax=Shewanella gaetbuli TaxID=220752 RepID=A0A9X1ZP26_9GAMM|nr:hypothetical protein [Shewanella gaetbuli]MCL1142990.1 hypothetical protein [Shewanella gaetbuli]
MTLDEFAQLQDQLNVDLATVLVNFETDSPDPSIRIHSSNLFFRDDGTGNFEAVAETTVEAIVDSARIVRTQTKAIPIVTTN